MGLLDDGESLRIKTNRRPKDRPQRKSRASQRRQGGFYKVNLLSREEHKYQMIKLMRSGRTLRETKALIRAASKLQNRNTCERLMREICSHLKVVFI